MSLARQQRYRRSLLKTIGRRSAHRDHTDIGIALREREISRYLNSHAVQSVALRSIFRRDQSPEKSDAWWTDNQCAPVVPFDYRRSRYHPILFYHKPRTTSGLRKLCVLPPVLKMWHTLASDLVFAQHQPGPHIGEWKGRGREWQMDRLLKSLVSPNQAVVWADIKRAFASVNIDALYELPYLPEQLIRRAIDYRSHSFVRVERREHWRDVSYYARHNAEEVERSPSGLMEGSPASNAIFSVLMDDLPDHLEEGIQAFIYCDNIILIAPTMSRALRAQEALVRYLAGHRAGPFDIRSSVSQASQHFEHLGYSILTREGPQHEVGLSIPACNKLGARIEDERFNPAEALKWLAQSYRHCSPDQMAGYVQRIFDEVTFRSRTPPRNNARLIVNRSRPSD
jgi:hypothetical protein